VTKGEVIGRGGGEHLADFLNSIAPQIVDNGHWQSEQNVQRWAVAFADGGN
jgi:hypothetical protein